MSKCLCYKCDCATIRRYKRKSRISGETLFRFQIYCGQTNTNIIDEEMSDEKLFFTEQLIEMECNGFKEASKPIPFKGEISEKLVKEAEEEAKKQRKDS